MATSPPAPFTVVAAVARLVADVVGPSLSDRVSAGPAPPAWTLDNADVPAYAQTTSVSGPTPTMRGGGRTHGWTSLVQVDLYEHDQAEDPARAADLLAALDGAHTDAAGGARRWLVDLETAQRVDAPSDAGWVRHRFDVRVTSLR